MKANILSIFLQQLSEVHIEWLKYQAEMLLMIEMPEQSQTVESAGMTNIYTY